MATGQNKGHGGKARGVVVKSLAERRRELGRPIVIEQAKQLSREPGGGFTVLEGGLKEGLAFRDQRGQTTGGGGAQRLAFLFEQGAAVLRLFDLLMPVIGAAVGSDFGGAVEQAHVGGRCDQGQGATEGAGRHGIIVEVKADPEGFIRRDRAHHVAGERVSGKRE